MPSNNGIVMVITGSGALALLGAGVIKSLKRMNLHREVYTIATSGGSCAGAFLQMENDPDDVVKFVIECSKTARSTWTGLFRLKEYLKGAIAQFSSEELPGKLRGNYEISGTGFWAAYLSSLPVDCRSFWCVGRSLLYFTRCCS
jgi:predicted acylesterase/phospholipase RssA